MSLTSKTKGFRTINIDGENFNWRLNSVLEVQPALRKYNKLVVDIDRSDASYEKNKKLPPYLSPSMVTSAFVRQAILFAIDRNWNIRKTSGLMTLTYKGGRFIVNTR